MRRLAGTGVVEGVASGQAVLLVRRGRALRVPVADARIDDEVARLERARERSRQQIAAIRVRLSAGPGAELAPAGCDEAGSGVLTDAGGSSKRGLLAPSGGRVEAPILR